MEFCKGSESIDLYNSRNRTIVRSIYTIFLAFTKHAHLRIPFAEAVLSLAGKSNRTKLEGRMKRERATAYGKGLELGKK